MKKTTPHLFVVIGISVALLGLAIFWLALLPVQLASALKGEIESRTGMQVKASSSGIGFQDGLSVRLNDVTLEGGDGQSAPSVSIERVTAGLSLTNLFGGKLRLESLNLESPLINIKTDAKTEAVAETEAGSGETAPETTKPSRQVAITLRNGTVKWSDAGRQVSYAVSDLNGIVNTEQDGSAKLELSGLFNGKLTRLAATVDDLSRVKDKGSPSDLTLSAGANSIAFSGRGRLRNGIEMDGKISARADSLRDISEWFGLKLSGFAETGKLKAESSLSWNGERLDLKQLAVAVGQANFTGSAALDARQSRPMLEATLDVDHLDFAIYGRRDGIASQSTSPAIAAPWTESQKDFRDLGALDANVDITAARLSVAGLDVGKTTMQLKLQDAALALSLSSEDVVGGKANADVQVIQSNGIPEATLRLSAENVSAKKFLQPLTGFAAVDGPLSLQADLSSKGDSTARLISSLGGTAQLAVKDGSINGLALLDFFAGQGKGWRLASNKATVLTSAEASFEIQDGIAQVTSAEVASNGVKVTAEGEIDLLRQNLDLVCKPSVEGAVKLPVQLAVTGPWTNPDVKTDIDPAKLKPKALLKTGKKAIKKLFGN